MHFLVKFCFLFSVDIKLFHKFKFVFQKRKEDRHPYSLIFTLSDNSFSSDRLPQVEPKLLRTGILSFSAALLKKCFHSQQSLALTITHAQKSKVAVLIAEIDRASTPERFSCCLHVTSTAAASLLSLCSSFICRRLPVMFFKALKFWGRLRV